MREKMKRTRAILDYMRQQFGNYISSNKAKLLTVLKHYSKELDSFRKEVAKKGKDPKMLKLMRTLT